MIRVKPNGLRKSTEIMTELSTINHCYPIISPELIKVLMVVSMVAITTLASLPCAFRTKQDSVAGQAHCLLLWHSWLANPHFLNNGPTLKV